MKLRQKLAAVLAATMVLSAVPVTTFAASKNSIPRIVTAREGTILTKADDVYLVMDFEDTILNAGKNIFYVDAENFSFSESEYKVNAVGVNKTDIATAMKEKLFADLNGELVDGKRIVGVKSASIAYDGANIDEVEAELQYYAEATKATTYELKTFKKKYKKTSLPTAALAYADTVNAKLANAELVLNDKGDYVKQDGAGNIDVSTGENTTPAPSTTDSAVRALIPSVPANTPIVTMKVVNGSLRVSVDPNGSTAVKVQIPVYGKMGKDEPVITVDARDSYATSGKYFLTKNKIETDKLMSVKFGDAKAITVDGGQIADITIVENQNDVFETSKKVTIELPRSSDLEFTTKEVTLEGKRGLGDYAGKDAVKVTPVFVVKNGETDRQKVEITLPGKTTLGAGEWVIKGLEVVPEDKRQEASIGDVEVTVKGDDIAEATAKVAKVAEYDLAYKCEKPVALVAGKGAKEVEVTLEEAVKETLDDKRWAFFELTDGAYIEQEQGDLIKDIIEIKRGSDKLTDDQYKNSVELIKDVDGNVVGFKLYFDYTGAGFMKADEANKLTFKFKVQAETNVTGPIELKAESRVFDEEKVTPVKVADVVAPIAVTFENEAVKVGLDGQALGTVTIKETDKAMLQKGKLYIDLDENNIEFAGKAKDLKVSTKDSTLLVEVRDVRKGVIELDVKRESKEAATLTIEGLVVDVDRTVAEGKVDASFFGPALRKFDGDWAIKEGNQVKYYNNDELGYNDTHSFIVEDFIQVGTKNTEDITDVSKAVTANFVIGSNKYTVNGEEKTMDAAAFAKDGRTMVPVRYLCDALGLPGDALSYSGNTIVILTNDKVISLQGGSKTMIVNGVNVTMTAATTIKDGRTYAPVSEIARALGLTSTWDAATQTATFTK